jgi:hypothetical protein
MTYRQILDEAIGDSPVSAVDVDQVIAHQRRGEKLRRWGVAGAGAAAVIAVIAIATQVLPHQSPVEPAAVPPITTVAGTPEDLLRLDDAVFAALKREVPNLTLNSWDHTDRTLVAYTGQSNITIDGATAHLMVAVERFGARRTAGWNCTGAVALCRQSSGPGGERLWTQVIPQGTILNGQAISISEQIVRILRPADDTLVTVNLSGLNEKGPGPITVEQQTAIALDPAIALAPVPPGVAVTPPPSSPPGTPGVMQPGTSTSGPAGSAQEQRIDNAVFASLRMQAPGIKGARSGTQTPQDLAAAWIDPDTDNTADVYFGQGRILVDGVSGLLSVQVERNDPGLDGDMKCGKNTAAYTCTAGLSPNGDRYRTATNIGGGSERTVSVHRKDGSWISVSLDADAPKGEFPLTPAQQQAVAFDQAIALNAR